MWLEWFLSPVLPRPARGEKRLFDILQRSLPDSFIVWYEPQVNNLYPDFIVLGPDFGLLVLEVKGWYAGDIERANHQFFDIRRKRRDFTKVETYQSPLRQGQGYVNGLMDRLLGYPILCNPDGNYQGRLSFPVGVGAIMSNLTEAQAREKGLYCLLEKPAVAYRDELVEWPQCRPELVIQRLKAMFKVDFSFPPLTADQISTIRGIIHPEIAIKEVPATQLSIPVWEEDTPDTPAPPDGSTVLLSLDVEQERLARTMGSGHRIFYGVAGSGKTVILLSRAKAIANRLLEHRVLILCFNITLAAHLRSTLHNDSRNPHYQSRITVLHFHDWAKTILGSLPHSQEFKDDEEYNAFLGQRLIERLSQTPTEHKWDSILVDEAHTFSPSWFLCCVAALKDPQNGDLMIVSDGSQSLYKRQHFTWKSVGIQAQGRSKRLSQNYRNTHEIMSAAWSVVQSVGNDSDDVTFPAVRPDVALRHGKKPVLHLARTKEDAVEALVDQVRSLCESGYSPDDIAILYRWKSRQDEPQFHHLLTRLDDLGMIPYWITESSQKKRSYNSQAPGIRIVTALSSLGLEFKVVLLLWLEQFADCCYADPEVAALSRRQLYVAMTRAQDELHLFVGKYARLVNELEHGGTVDVRKL
ncbi:3'-5' exonuclease [Leptothermofonsia sp. ETS-13]|uniref:3'-5' exonuclease n=1 Tax=Leptothermofonsia sp. ETS-13 TaxID=3035696 RepID=UPI003BA25D8C